MTGFKPLLLVNELPQADSFIQIWTDPDVPQIACPKWEDTDIDYIILTGQNEQSMTELMVEVNKRGQELTEFFRDHYAAGSWDVMIKPIAWMESIEAAIELYETLSFLDEGDQSEILTDIQLEFNEPWGRVKLIDSDTWEELKIRYSLI